MKRYKPNEKTFVTEYFSLNEFLTEINSLPNNRFMKDVEASSREYSDDDNWSGTKTYEEATKLITNGWDSQAKKLSKAVALSNNSSGTVKCSKPSYGVVGSQASVPRYLQGIPTNMVSRQMTYAKQKVITITKGISYSAFYTAEKILEESTKALQIVQALESSGQRVRLNIMLATTKSGRRGIQGHAVCKVCIKQPDERLNISKIAFPLSHPAMLRRFFFKWFEVDPFITFDLGESFGSPSEMYVKELVLEDNEYFIPEIIPDINEVIAQLKKPKAKKSPV